MRRNTSSRHQSRYERTQTVTGKQWGIVITIFLIIISVIGFVAYKKFQGKVEYDKVTACPMVNGVVKPAKQTVVVIDETDVLSPPPTRLSQGTSFQFRKRRDGIRGTSKRLRP